MVIKVLHSASTTSVVDLGVKLPVSGDYALNANDITLIDESVFFEDRMPGIFQDLNLEPNYSFNSVAGNIPPRFALHFGLSITGVDEVGSSVEIYASNKQINVILNGTERGTMTVFDMAGTMVHSQSLTSERTNIELNSASGIYVVKVEMSDRTITKKVSIQ